MSRAVLKFEKTESKHRRISTYLESNAKPLNLVNPLRVLMPSAQEGFGKGCKYGP